MPEHDRGKHWNRDDAQKPGAPPRSASEPHGEGHSVRSDKTRTDPSSGEPNAGRQRPNPSHREDRA